jgi:putative endonuclease
MNTSTPTFLYILYSKSLNEYYVGISNNPQRRLFYHNMSHKGWTRRGRPWKLMFTKQFDSKQLAESWEAWIKQQKNRNIIDRIIDGNFDWQDQRIGNS